MKKSTGLGFSAVEGLLITIIIGILGGVGWYVWHANSQINKNLNAADSTKLAIQSAKPIKHSMIAKMPTAANYWELYLSNVLPITVKILSDYYR
jgi:predicted negative regulator of RcsB-dependent stress response